MAQILFLVEENRPPGMYSTYPATLRIVARGWSPDEILTDAQRQAQNMGARTDTLRAVGLDTLRADWEVLTGKKEDADKFSWLAKELVRYPEKITSAREYQEASAEAERHPELKSAWNSYWKEHFCRSVLSAPR